MGKPFETDPAVGWNSGENGSREVFFCMAKQFLRANFVDDVQDLWAHFLLNLHPHAQIPHKAWSPLNSHLQVHPRNYNYRNLHSSVSLYDFRPIESWRPALAG